MKFSLEGGKCVILDAKEAKDESPRILEMHAISFDRSKTLRSAFSFTVSQHMSRLFNMSCYLLHAQI